MGQLIMVWSSQTMEVSMWTEERVTKYLEKLELFTSTEPYEIGNVRMRKGRRRNQSLNCH
jgi:hypothetical protein